MAQTTFIYSAGVSTHEDVVTVINSNAVDVTSTVTSSTPLELLNATERKTLTSYDPDGVVVGVTRVIQTDESNVVYYLIAADVTLDASWRKYIDAPSDEDFVINMELADFSGIVPDVNVFGQVGGVPSIGNGVDTGGNKVAMRYDLPSNPAGIVRMVSTKTSNISVTVKHDGTESATGICYSVDGGTPVYGAVAADTNLNLSIPHNGGAPVEIYIWSATSASSGKKGELTYLTVVSDSLTSLDVSGLTALATLTCNSNSLTFLDVSGLTALTSLSFDSNQLTSLDVSGLTALTDLYCNDNNLTSLDVSGLTALSGLNCHANNLTSLDVSGLTALTYLTCYGNNLTSILATGVDLSFEYYGSGSSININSLSEAALIAFADSLATTTTGVISYGSNTGSAAFETWLTNNPTLDKGYIWNNS